MGHVEHTRKRIRADQAYLSYGERVMHLLNSLPDPSRMVPDHGVSPRGFSVETCPGHPRRSHGVSLWIASLRWWRLGSLPLALLLLFSFCVFTFAFHSTGRGHMKEKMRIMSERPLNAETPGVFLRSWITPNSIFFDRNQGAVPGRISPGKWKLTVEGEVERPGVFGFESRSCVCRGVWSGTLLNARGTAVLSWQQAHPETHGP